MAREEVILLVFYRKPLLALCQMILHPKQYDWFTDHPGQKVRVKIVKLILKHTFSLKEVLKNFLFKSIGDNGQSLGWMHLGEEVSITEAIAYFDNKMCLTS